MAGCSICKHQGKRENEFPCCNCVHNAREHFEPYTNADRIRAMSDEELAEFINCPHDMHLGDCRAEENEKIPCSECVLQWLKSEAKE